MRPSPAHDRAGQHAWAAQTSGGRRSRCLAALGAVLVAAIAGCGGGEDPVLSAAQQERLLGHVTDARAAAGEDDRAATRSALDELEREVRELAGDGVLDEGRAAALLAGVERAAARADEQLSPPPAQEPGGAPAPAVQEPPGLPTEGEDGEDDDEEKPGKRRGKPDKEDKPDDEGKPEKDKDEDGD